MFSYWQATSKRSTLFIVGCKVCRFFLHSWWRKGSDASCLKNILEAWFIEEPIDASDEVAPSSEKDGRKDDSAKSSSSLPSNFSGHTSKRKHAGDLDQDASSVKRRCALHGQPGLETAAAAKVIDLTRRLSRM